MCLVEGNKEIRKRYRLDMQQQPTRRDKTQQGKKKQHDKKRSKKRKEKAKKKIREMRVTLTSLACHGGLITNRTL